MTTKTYTWGSLMRNTTAILTSFLALSGPVAASTTEMTGQPLVDGILSTIIYGIIGIVFAAIAFKMADWLTPGDLKEQIAEHENRALAILAGSMVLGVCLIIAAVMIG